jgi:hypothetical protein
MWRACYVLYTRTNQELSQVKSDRLGIRAGLPYASHPAWRVDANPVAFGSRVTCRPIGPVPAEGGQHARCGSDGNQQIPGDSRPRPGAAKVQRGSRLGQGGRRLHERLAHHERGLAAAAADGRDEAAGIVVENGPGVDNVRPGDHVIFSFRPHCGRCRYCSSGQTMLCIGHNDTPRWRMHDGTARVALNGEPVNQMARIGTFSEEVVCPAEQVVKVRDDAVHSCRDHRLQRRDRDRRGGPPRPGPGRVQRAGGRMRRRRAQRRSGRAARRRKPDHRLRFARQ